ncbi:MAG TPA: hypothetical protein VNA29_05125 [Sphingomicrobium sp.]|nr:hypothetical protein [Sphingomicrobium sp.]
MKLPVSTLVTLSGAVTLASCVAAPVQESRSPKAVEELAQALAGKAAGRATNCISNYRSTQMQVIDDWTILYRDGRTVYVQNPRGGCRGLNSGMTLVTRQHGNQLCSGDIHQLVDLRSGHGAGACVFSPFVPYRRAS